MSKPPTRRLGKSGPWVPALGFGVIGLSGFYGQVESDEERFKVLDGAHELGEIFWDSADIYKDNEDLLGKWFRRTGQRSQIFLASKFGNILHDDGTRTVRSDPEYVHTACARSLARLGVEKIDLYYMHRSDRKTPIEKTVEAMVQLKHEGKIDYLGLCEVSAETLRRAHKVHPISAVQMEYSPFALDVESGSTKLLATCRELGVYDFDEDDYRRTEPRFSDENFSKNLKLVEQLNVVAEKNGCKTAQLVLAWLMAQVEDAIPIPGTKKIKYLEQNLAAFELILTQGELEEITQIVDSSEVCGKRYKPQMMSYSFADTSPL